MPLLEVDQLRVEFGSTVAPFKAVDGVSLRIDAGEVVGIVGESGSGKSVTALALMGLIDEPGRVSAQTLRFDGHDLLTMPLKQRRQMLGRDIAMIFQDPMSSLNPCFTVAYQLMEMVEIPAAKSRLDVYPHQLSGGMSQRVMIAIAIACKPRLLIADEPTTALDVTIQAQIMDLLVNLQKAHNMALVMITHDLAVVAEVAHRVAVMYAGQVVETGSVDRLFDHPAHPYTHALLQAVPERSHGARRLSTLKGMVPGQYDRPKGCLLSPRCPRVQERCRAERPALDPHNGDAVRCFFPITHGVPA